jgi:hypothetical protein
MKTDLLAVDYCHEVGGLICSHCRNGLTLEEYTTANDVEDFHFKTIDGKQRKWQSDESNTIFRYGKRETRLNLGSSSFADWWNEMADFLELEVPFLCWSEWKSNNTVGVDRTSVSDISGAHLVSTV